MNTQLLDSSILPSSPRPLITPCPRTWSLSLCSPHYKCMIPPSLFLTSSPARPSPVPDACPGLSPAPPQLPPHTLGTLPGLFVYLPVHIKRNRMLPSKEEKAGLQSFLGPFRKQRVKRTGHHLDSPNTIYKPPEKCGKSNRCSPDSPPTEENTPAPPHGRKTALGKMPPTKATAFVSLSK